MDEQTFRRLAPDAVAGRLDDDTYARWKTFAKSDPEREAFVARITAAHERLSSGTEVVRETGAHDVHRRVPKRVFYVLAPFFALFGGLGGVLAMYSYLETRDGMAQQPDNRVGEAPAAPGGNAPETGPRDKPRTDEPEPEPEPDPEPEREPPGETGDPPDTPDLESEPDSPVPEEGLRLSGGKARIRAAGGTGWEELGDARVLKRGDRVAVLEGESQFLSPRLRISASGRVEFEVIDGGILFAEGEAAVRVKRPGVFKTRTTTWTMESGAFVVSPGRFGGGLYVLEGAARLAYRGESETAVAPTLARLDAVPSPRALTPDEIREFEVKLLGAHDVLLLWDAETSATTPARGEIFQPGAFGEGSAMRRALGQLEVGSRVGEELFAAREGARLRMRVKTDATHVHLTMRVHVKDGYRAADARIPVPPGEGWVVIDVPLSILRAGRNRDEPAWIPGTACSALALSPGVNPDRPLLRRELSVDDVLVYVPR